MSASPERPDTGSAPSPNRPRATAPDGTDLTLIRWMLSLTPTERLRVLQEHVEAVEAIRRANPRWTSAPS